MLELKNLSIRLLKDGRQIIENYNFTLNRGDKAVVIGEEGNGKSTLLKMIYDERLIDGYCEYTGDIIRKGALGYLPQTMDQSLLNQSVAYYFEGGDFYCHKDVLRWLNLMPDFLMSGQRIETLSGGEKIKIQLAKILMGEPDVLLLDEPTNDIDINTLEWLEGFIKSTKLPVLFVSHDETLIENTANVIIHIEQLVRKTKPCVTVARLSYNEYVAARTALFDKQMQVARKQREDYAEQMKKWRQIYNRVDHEQEAISRQDPGGARLLKKKMKAVKSQEKRLERQTEDFLEIPQVETAILTKFDESIFIPKSKPVLDFYLEELKISDKVLSENIRLTVLGGAHIGITGQNGVGKSTLLKVIWSQLKDRRDVKAAYMPQDYTEKLDYAKTPLMFLAENYSKDDITRARTCMGSMKFTHEEMTGKIGALSGGQKAKLLFLDMVIRGADVLLLDEPTRNFSPLSSPVIRETLKAFGGAIISISHDRKYLNEVCDTVYELKPEGLFVLNDNDKFLLGY